MSYDSLIKFLAKIIHYEKPLNSKEPIMSADSALKPQYSCWMYVQEHSMYILVHYIFIDVHLIYIDKR